MALFCSSVIPHSGFLNTCTTHITNLIQCSLTSESLTNICLEPNGIMTWPGKALMVLAERVCHRNLVCKDTYAQHWHQFMTYLLNL